jgi:hypothetical protein
MGKSNMQELSQPHAKHPVERMVEDVVRSANQHLSNEEQTDIYNDLMVSLFETIRNRAAKGIQPVRISEGNKVWKNYRNIYMPDDDVFHEHFERACQGMISLYTGKIPGNYGKA